MKCSKTGERQQRQDGRACAYLTWRYQQWSDRLRIARMVFRENPSLSSSPSVGQVSPTGHVRMDTS
ncbi:MAG: hypothetical protein KatS3mg107_0277 [Gemmataceae bacterium]|jgi:hypothetical protein|nr:MAG: hypothetical protein KatS3mg107_0277 [Gemmataceae bacterium]